MDGLVLGIVNDANTASEVAQQLSSAGYTQDGVSIVSGNQIAASGPLQGIALADVPQKLMSYGATEDIASSYYSEMQEEYFLIAVSVYTNAVATVTEVLANYNTQDIQFVHL